MWPSCFQLLGIVLAGVSLAGNVVSGQTVPVPRSANIFVTFDDSGFDGYSDGTTNTSILANPNDIDYFAFNTTPNVKVEYVSLMDGTTVTTITTTNDTMHDIDINISALSTTTEWSLSLSNPGKIFDAGFDLAVLYFEVVWNDTEYMGKSYSRAFTYANSLSEVTDVTPFESDVPYDTETYSSLTATSTSLTSASASSTSITSASSGSTASSDSTKSSPSSGASSGGSGIKAGAIAGIVVGVVAGLAIICGLAWFCLRRRQRKNSGYNKSSELARSVEPYGGLNGTSGRYESVSRGGVGSGVSSRSAAAEGLIREKEERAITAATSVTERDGGPNSPYTDDYSSVMAPVIPVAPVTSAASAASESVGTPVISGQVAALIEDGMTPEDVARLAAEEMELDAAIQHARRVRTNGSQP